ncbi:MAG: hypothetical protein AMS18_01750 [Gemmatimonas sp. SG8_17]|nr:MAG: hypothetical protein AMS18_01750 [Gemmatimonas sp. SG8_17]
MNPALTVLVAADDPLVLGIFRDVVDGEEATRMVVARSGTQALDYARKFSPDCVFSSASLDGLDGLELCRRIRADRRLGYTLFGLLANDIDREMRAAAVDAGVDDFLSGPPEPDEVRVRLRRMARVRDQLKRLRVDERCDAEAALHLDQVFSLLVHLIDSVLPGAAVRGSAVASSALKIANRFEVPEHLLRDLEIAARLCEIGKVVTPATGEDGTVENVQADHLPVYVMSSKAVMRQVSWLREAAEVVGSIAENWDGTGLPDRLYKGQIPLRSRILRILIDFHQALTGPGAHDPLEIVARLAEHGGTRYDPVVVLHFQTVIGDVPEKKWQGHGTLIAVRDLKDGMILSEDLFTSSGVKLLARGATLTGATLEVIKRRNQVDPILEGAWIRRETP